MPALEEEFRELLRHEYTPEKITEIWNGYMIGEQSEAHGTLSVEYQIERVMYGIAILLGFIASAYTIRKFRRNCKKNMDVAARLLSYKISLSVADALILFVYAPTQLTWITTYWWYGGEMFCRAYKFIATFAFYLTGNMQVLIALDRLVTMSHIAEVHAKGTVDYNNRLLLAIAWMLATVCSLPQLFIFKIVHQSADHPQCSSIWNEYTIMYAKEQAIRQMYSIPHDSVIKEEWLSMQQWETVGSSSKLCHFYRFILYVWGDRKKTRIGREMGKDKLAE
ncbi:hypothetical protein PMAYCL1PPCAC_16573 [Pristionchus mayeri]|uniref:G-protein coupled receptors family 1 profile domain-containing protein n=1 Tax=Pristionchus mayeri TaxID=1317129 RepID=A0AAN5HZE0_9BILA|nr:hypothetical protein PMAYCL1PPCAC_16573 [Pristionchus mayeri]